MSRHEELPDDVKALRLWSRHFTNHDNEAQDVEVDVTRSRGQQVAGQVGD